MTQQDLRTLARQLSSQINEELLRLGNVLVAIQDAGLYHHWGYTTWIDYLREEIGMDKNTAHRLQSLSRWARIMQLTVKQRERLGRLGKFKAYYVTKLCKDKRKINHWLTVAEQNTARHLKAELAGISPDETKRNLVLWVDGSEQRSIREAMDLAYELSEYELTKGGLLTAVCEDYIRRHKRKRSGKAAL